MDNFTQISFSTNNLDSYYIRTSIFNALKEMLPKLSGDLLDIGCGKMPYREYVLKNSEVKKYVGLDIEEALEYDSNVKPDYTWDGNKIPFGDASFETVFATEVLEHCPDPDAMLRETRRVLKSGGIFFFTIPFLWPLHEAPHDEYRFTPYALERILKEAGFKDIEIKSGGGWHASLAQMLGLWVRRAPLRNWQRRILSLFAKPIMKFLIKKDKKIDISIKDQQMFTNFYGTAEK